MKPVDANLNAYNNSSKEFNDEDPEFEIGDIVWISKYKNIFAKGYVSNWSEEDVVITRIKNTVHWHVLLLILKVKKFLKHFTNRNGRK